MPDDKVVALVVDIAYIDFAVGMRRRLDSYSELESLKQRTTTTCIQHFQRRSPSTGLDVCGTDLFIADSEEIADES